MIYIVKCGYYSDVENVGYYDNLEDAEQFIAQENAKGGGIWGDDYYVEELDKMTAPKKVKLYRHHEVVFDIGKGMRQEPNRYDVYAGEKKETTMRSEYLWFSIYVTADTRKKAEKIAQDYYAEFLSFVNEYDVATARNLMATKIKRV